MFRLLKICLLLLMIVPMFIGCQTVDEEQYEGSGMIALHNKEFQDFKNKADGAKREVRQMEQVDRVRAVAIDNDIYVGLAVSGFDRFFLKDIRKSAQDQVKKKYKKENVHVSTDRKIEMELEDIERELHTKNMSKDQLRKKLDKVEEDMKG
ncbi:YhcN/YlaJ family sporulation lipoprotein [Bacillus shivajii]|uniref:YhcN/YlaJ family sporulation lipoprotein n=1 Tax=Bacillus shivajii TaxID=1983719 RepID=UPI001CFB85F1|nr:YhcN/YlaJ family sporulation lipoprotein [Bacillus shivajii]UCZ54715.1 YhcN/YlaJ family sporulation lipoprotein [Bacillus shivajii]